ncbi:MAG: Lrp/AsnC family transcriptional regulator [Nocardioides sp.]|uniref:Lrp/AsnC family transcriptional regulator n=1 Tax=Nocardioides sp. TaxID=35761 RepID=UPI0039E50915
MIQTAAVPWSEDDLRLVRALQLAPRASFARLADVLGLHERTVARRYGALHRQGALRVFGTVNPLAVGQELWHVRVRCRPDGADALSRALAARGDVAWLGIAAAGTEVSFSVRSVSVEQRDLLLTRILPRAAHVLDIEASVVLHLFLGLTPHDWEGFAPLLRADEVEALTGGRSRAVGPARAKAEVGTEPWDPVLFRELALDGRASTAHLAAAAGVSEGRVSRRLQRLLDAGVLVIDLDLAVGAFGYDVSARVHLRVRPGRIQAVGEALAAMPEVGFAAATSGRDNLLASASCRDLAHLYEFGTARTGALEGVESMEVVPYQRLVKQSGGRLADGRLAAPE